MCVCQYVCVCVCVCVCVRARVCVCREGGRGDNRKGFRPSKQTKPAAMFGRASERGDAAEPEHSAQGTQPQLLLQHQPARESYKSRSASRQTLRPRGTAAAGLPCLWRVHGRPDVLEVEHKLLRQPLAQRLEGRLHLLLADLLVFLLFGGGLYKVGRPQGQGHRGGSEGVEAGVGGPAARVVAMGETRTARCPRWLPAWALEAVQRDGRPSDRRAIENSPPEAANAPAPGHSTHTAALPPVHHHTQARAHITAQTCTQLIIQVHTWTYTHITHTHKNFHTRTRTCRPCQGRLPLRKYMNT
jgi:hypothetical protein